MAYPWFLSARLGFRVRAGANDPVDSAIAGAYRWRSPRESAPACPSDHTDDRTFHPRGLALLYAGVQSCANLRWAGLLTGGRPEQDAVWDTLFGGRQFHIRDYY